MMQAEVNKKLENLKGDLTSTDMTEGYVTWGKSKNNAMICGAGENNLFQSQTITVVAKKRY